MINRSSEDNASDVKTVDNVMTKKRIIVLMGILTVIIAIGTFLNTRIDDEREYTSDEYVAVPDTANDSDGVTTIDEDTGLKAGDIIAEIPEMHVDAGEFTIDVEHQNENDLEAVIYDGEVELDRFVLPSSELNTKHTFGSNDNLYRLRIVFLYGGSGVATIKRSVLYSKGLFYTDTVFYALMLILFLWFVGYIFIKHDIRALPFKDKLFWGVLILFLIWINYPFYRPMILGYDIRSHMSRIECMLKEIQHGQFPVVMFTEALDAKGTVAILYPNLFLYIPVLLRMCHVSPDGAIRAAYMLINYATCGTAYYAGRKLFNDRYKALYFMILYALLPYRLLTMTWRWAYGEALALVFIPLVITGLYEVLIGDKRNWILLTIGMSGVLQSHMLAFALSLAACGIMAACFVDRIFKDKRLISIIYAVLSAVFINLWLIGSFLYYYFSDVDYYLQMVRPEFTDDLYHIAKLFQVSKDASYIAGGGLILLLVAAIWIHLMELHKDAHKRYSLVCIFIGVIFMIMELRAFPWETLQKIQCIQQITGMIQFPFRFSLVGQSLMLTGCVMALLRIERLHAIQRIILGTAAILLLIQGYITEQSYLDDNTDNKLYWETVRFESDTDGYISYDYIPTDYDEEEFPDAAVGIGADVSGFWHDHMNSGFSYASDRDAYVDIPLFYYEGYRAYDEDGKELEIIKGDAANMRIELPDSRGTVKSVKIVYNMTLWHIFFFISMASVVALTVVLHITKKKTRSDYIGFAE